MEQLVLDLAALPPSDARSSHSAPARPKSVGTSIARNRPSTPPPSDAPETDSEPVIDTESRAAKAGRMLEVEVPTELEAPPEPAPPAEAQTTEEPEPPVEVETADEPEPPVEAQTADEPEPPVEVEAAGEPEPPVNPELDADTRGLGTAICQVSLDDDGASLPPAAHGSLSEPLAPLDSSPGAALAPMSVEALLESIVDLNRLPQGSNSPSDTSDSPAPADVAAPARQPRPLQASARKDWRRWAVELDRARGPKSLASVERMFVSSYVPLSDASAFGIAEPQAAEVLTYWSDSFARSYLDAFAALRLRGQRPNMVLDVPELAKRIARLHGARSVQLLVVDAMRFDVGLRVHEYLRPKLDQTAVLVERLLLWSALPSTTAVQLELLRRGPEGLRELSLNMVTDIPVARGHTASTLRRLKSGHREVIKLDLIESEMAVAGGPLVERLDAVAERTANIIADYMLNLAQPTLVAVFGDHGFRIEETVTGTGPARQGGASPDEVLVPAFAWMVGRVH